MDVESLKSGLQLVYRIKIYKNPSPLRIYFHVLSGISSGKLLISICKPNNPIKVFYINNTEHYYNFNIEGISYKYIFITVETSEDITFEIKYFFGKFKYKDFVLKGKQPITIEEEVDKHIKMILKSEDLLHECRKEAAEILLKRKRESLLTRSKSRLRYSDREMSRASIAMRRQMVARKSVENEENKRLEAFFHLNRWPINRLYERILRKFLLKTNNERRSMRTLVGLIKLYKKAKVIAKKYEVYIKDLITKREELISSAKIYIRYSLWVKKAGKTLKNRIGHKAFTYNKHNII